MKNKFLYFKKTSHFLRTYCIGFGLAIGATAHTQPTADSRVTEQRVSIQKLYIEATKERVANNKNDAIVLLNEVVTKDKYHDAAYYDLARLYQQEGDLYKAANMARSALAIDEKNVWYALLYASILKEQGNMSDAAGVYEKVVTNNPDNADFYFDLAYLYIKMNKPEAAIRTYDRLEGRIGVSERTARRKHTLYLTMNKPAKAENELLNLVKKFPDEVVYYHLLAEHYQQTGDTEKAKEVYTNILKRWENDTNAQIALANKQKGSQTELLYLQNLESLFLDKNVALDLKVNEVLPYIEKMPNLSADIVQQLTRFVDFAMQAHSAEAKAFALGGDWYYSAGRSEEALAFYRNATKLDNGVFSVWERMMAILLERREYADLLALTEEVLDLYPNQASVYYMNGLAQSYSKSYKKAGAAFDQALLMVGKDVALKYKLHAELAMINFHLKQFVVSDEHFEEALKLNPKDYYLLANYAFCLAERGANLEKANTMIASANGLSPNNPMLQDIQGWVLFKLNKFEEAETWTLKAIQNGGDKTPIILEHYGDVLYRLNKPEEAFQYWQSAKENGGNSSGLERKIAEKKL